MTKFIKHVGKCKNSGRRCVVVKNQIPEMETKALIVDIDSIPDAYQNFLMDLVQSNAAQNTNDLGEILARYQSPDAGQTMLLSLHNRQYMCPMDITNILMYPAPNYPIELTKVIHLLNGGDVDEAKSEHDTLHGTMNKLKAEDYEHNERIARNILMEAERLEFEAKKKRDTAYGMAPQLNPAKFTSTHVVEENMESIESYLPPIQPVQLTPEQEMLLSVSRVNSPSTPLNEEKKPAAKKPGRKPKAK